MERKQDRYNNNSINSNNSNSDDFDVDEKDQLKITNPPTRTISANAFDDTPVSPGMNNSNSNGCNKPPSSEPKENGHGNSTSSTNTSLNTNNIMNNISKISFNQSSTTSSSSSSSSSHPQSPIKKTRTERTEQENREHEHKRDSKSYLDDDFDLDNGGNGNGSGDGSGDGSYDGGRGGGYRIPAESTTPPPTSTSKRSPSPSTTPLPLTSSSSTSTTSGQTKPPKRLFKVFEVLKTTFTVDARYRILDPVGRGAYGIVVCARDTKFTREHASGRNVAIKKISGIFEHATFAKRTLREIRLMRLLKHKNLLGILSVMQPPNAREFSDLYIVSELMETDLSSVIKSPQELSLEHVNFFLLQILQGVQYLHSYSVVHRDLKPRNLLVNSDCDLKICDFGLARVDYPDMQWKTAAMTDYVATRWYRAPEIIVGAGEYTKAVDVWSVGCILGELLLRQPVFPGGDSDEQLYRICELVGTPSDAVIRGIRKPGARELLLSMPRREHSSFRAILPRLDKDVLDILKRMLTFDPAERWGVEELLRHPYFEGAGEEQQSQESPSNSNSNGNNDNNSENGENGEKPMLPTAAFGFERGASTKEELRDEILCEIWIHSRNELAEDALDAQAAFTETTLDGGDESGENGGG